MKKILILMYSMNFANFSFAKLGVKSFAFREIMKTQKISNTNSDCLMDLFASNDGIKVWKVDFKQKINSVIIIANIRMKDFQLCT